MARLPSLPLPAETQRALTEHDRRWPIKLSMRAVATFFAFIAMILFAVTTSLSKLNYGGNDWVDGLPLAPVCCALNPSAAILRAGSNETAFFGTSAACALLSTYRSLVFAIWLTDLLKVLLALIYNPIVLFLSLVHRHGRPIHPGWHVGVDLFVWALAVPAIVFSVGEGWFWYWQPVLIEFENGFVPCDNEYNFWSQYCNPLIYSLGKMEMAANVFLALIL